MGVESLKSNLLAGEYQTYEAFFADLWLIWDNAKMYNKKESDLYQLADDMEKRTRTELEKFKADNQLQVDVLPAGSALTRARSRVPNSRALARHSSEIQSGFGLVEAGAGGTLDSLSKTCDRAALASLNRR